MCDVRCEGVVWMWDVGVGVGARVVGVAESLMLIHGVIATTTHTIQIDERKREIRKQSLNNKVGDTR